MMDRFEQRLADSLKAAAEQMPNAAPVVERARRSAKASIVVAALVAASIVSVYLMVGRGSVTDPVADNPPSLGNQNALPQPPADAPCATVFYKNKIYQASAFQDATPGSPLGIGKAAGCGEGASTEITVFAAHKTIDKGYLGPRPAGLPDVLIISGPANSLDRGAWVYSLRMEVRATNGKLGFVDKGLLDLLTGGFVGSPEEALAWQKANESRTESILIPVYPQIGFDQIGEFPISPSRAPLEIPPDTDSSTLPAEVKVTCRPSGIEVDTRAIQTSASGVVVVVSSTMPSGSYLNSASSGGGSSGGSLLPTDSEPDRRVLDLAPGTVTLGCWDPSTDDEFDTTIKVTDPAGNFRRAVDAISATGCVFKPGIYEWAVLGRGPSAEEAIQALADSFATHRVNAENKATFSARPLAAGYVAAKTQMWMIYKDDKAHATAAVTRGTTDYLARPEQPCE